MRAAVFNLGIWVFLASLLTGAAALLSTLLDWQRLAEICLIVFVAGMAVATLLLGLAMFEPGAFWASYPREVPQ